MDDLTNKLDMNIITQRQKAINILEVIIKGLENEGLDSNGNSYADYVNDLTDALEIVKKL